MSHDFQPKYIILSKPEIYITLMQNFWVSCDVRKGTVNTYTEIVTNNNKL